MAGNAQTLTTFSDQRGRTHKVVLMADRLLLDLVGSGPPRVLALLRPDEGVEHARAVVFGSGSRLVMSRGRSASKLRCGVSPV